MVLRIWLLLIRIIFQTSIRQHAFFRFLKALQILRNFKTFRSISMSDMLRHNLFFKPGHVKFVFKILYRVWSISDRVPRDYPLILSNGLTVAAPCINEVLELIKVFRLITRIVPVWVILWWNRFIHAIFIRRPLFIPRLRLSSRKSIRCKSSSLHMFQFKMKHEDLLNPSINRGIRSHAWITEHPFDV